MIGSNIVKDLALRNYNQKILVVDRISSRKKYLNLPSLRNIELIDPVDLELVFKKILNSSVKPIIYHMGACSDTTEKDGEYLYKNNYAFSKLLIDFAVKESLTIINASSASVYGLNLDSEELEKNENPINHYAFTKLLVDHYIHQKIQENTNSKILSLRFFNVYGFGEFAKNRMASLAYKIYLRLNKSQTIQLFDESCGCKAGEHSRDFVYVEDVLKIINQCIKKEVYGIYNLGSSMNRTFNDLALCCINSYNAVKGVEKVYDLEELIKSKLIEYISFPNDLNDKYQSYTLAKMDKLSSNSIEIPATSLEEGILDYFIKLDQFEKTYRNFFKHE